jgi:hypothetical protein
MFSGKEKDMNSMVAGGDLPNVFDKFLFKAVNMIAVKNGSAATWT